MALTLSPIQIHDVRLLLDAVQENLIQLDGNIKDGFHKMDKCPDGNPKVLLESQLRELEAIRLAAHAVEKSVRQSALASYRNREQLLVRRCTDRRQMHKKRVLQKCRRVYDLHLEQKALEERRLAQQQELEAKTGRKAQAAVALVIAGKSIWQTQPSTTPGGSLLFNSPSSRSTVYQQPSVFSDAQRLYESMVAVPAEGSHLESPSPMYASQLPSFLFDGLERQSSGKRLLRTRSTSWSTP
ncbi:hypothetical protein HDU91_005171 [Kappamyces sp. JEL0680]|nr:hypothetical protein HDU91_005171 [Kappamyces sp. JEL0680]